MAVAVQGRQNLKREVDVDPLDQILKGLQVAKDVFGISEADSRIEALKQDKLARQKQDQLDAQIRMAAAGLKLDESGNVIENKESEFFKKKTQEKDSSLADAIKLLTIENLKAKQGELGATQAKQAGLYEAGKVAEKQYEEATKNKEEYDPTSVASALRNVVSPNALKNEKAQAAEAAQSAWVESYLRDASGAAIPPGERMAYAKDFFPRAGDSDEVVANKKKLREQKMENAKIGAGSRFVPKQDKAIISTYPKQLRKDGQVAVVNSAGEEKEARSEGWK